MRSKYIFLLLLFFASGNISRAQCCSGGSPASGITKAGLVDKGKLRFSTFVRHSAFQDFFSGNSEISSDKFLLNEMFYTYQGLSIAYGLSKRFNIDLDAGYYYGKTQIYNLVPEYRLTGSGLSSLTFTLKYNIYRHVLKDIEVTAGAGLRIPARREPVFVDGVKLPIEIQPSLTAFSNVFMLFSSKSWKENRYRISMINRCDISYDDRADYRYGINLSHSVLFSTAFFKKLITIAEVRFEQKSPDSENGEIRKNNGSNMILVSPRLSYAILKNLEVSAAVDLPVYKDYKGEQITLQRSFVGSLIYTFELHE